MYDSIITLLPVPFSFYLLTLAYYKIFCGDVYCHLCLGGLMMMGVVVGFLFLFYYLNNNNKISIIKINYNIFF